MPPQLLSNGEETPQQINRINSVGLSNRPQKLSTFAKPSKEYAVRKSESFDS